MNEDILRGNTQNSIQLKNQFDEVYFDEEGKNVYIGCDRDSVIGNE